MMTEDPHSRELLELLIGGWRAQAVYVAAKLAIPDHLSEGPKSSAALAARTGMHADSLHRLLRLLVGLRIICGDNSTGFSLTPLGSLLRSDSPVSLRDLAVCYGEVFNRCWLELLHTVRTGESAFTHIYGKPLFEHLAEHPDDSRIFDGAMAAGTAFFADVPIAYDFSGARTVVDLGGGEGRLLASILTAHPHLEGILVEVDHVIAAAAARLPAQGIDGRCQLVAGDIFQSVPPGGDVYLLCRVLQDWSDEQCLRLLGNCRQAMGPDAVLLLIERVIPEDGRSSLALEWDVHLMVAPGGRERTETEYHVLLSQTGFHLQRIALLSLDVSVLVAVIAGC